VDGLGGDVGGSIISRHPDAASTLDRWSTDPNFWTRRAALLALIDSLKLGADFGRFAGYADSMLEEREFFIRKAIGWVLREVGKKRPRDVYGWLLPRAQRASGVTVCEAVKHLEPEQRAAVLSAYQRRREVAGRREGTS
jgi:3-methyladenine DNA glycosylase AlkD